MLDINLFREEKSHKPEIVGESQRRCFASIDLVDEIIKLDKEWRQCQFEVENYRKEFNHLNKQIAQLRIAGEDASEVLKLTAKNKQESAEKEAEVRDAFNLLKYKLAGVGNLVHDSVPVSNDEVCGQIML